MEYPKDSVAIRTLGKAGAMYKAEILSLMEQTVPPERIYVYIAHGYELPERVADEVYVYCEKGMAHQRSLPFDEITTEYILLCDDDVFFKPKSVELLFDALLEHDADCISPNVFPNHEMRLREKLVNAAFYGTFPSLFQRYAFRIRRSSYYSYRNSPRTVMEAQSCAGPCMLVKKAVNNALDYQDENWLDTVPYTSGQDMIFAYKMYRYGFKLIIHYDSGIIHMDGGTGHVKDLAQADFNKRMIRYAEWYRAVYEPERGLGKPLAVVSFYAFWLWLFLLALASYVLGRNKYKLSNCVSALKAGKDYVKSDMFRALPKWDVKR